jgi:hypothetical protein
VRESLGARPRGSGFPVDVLCHDDDGDAKRRRAQCRVFGDLLKPTEFLLRKPVTVGAGLRLALFVEIDDFCHRGNTYDSGFGRSGSFSFLAVGERD